MSSLFKIDEHVLDCQHIREYARATATSQEDVLKLSIKQYTPLDNLEPQEGDVTIIGAHANGFPKEMYEPLWEDLLTRSRSNGFRIRSIWIADIAQEGESGILNEQLLGDDPSWADHPRDLLHMINHFRMPLPLVGIGHSLGGNMICNLSFMHPRLLTTVILLDPVIQIHPKPQIGTNPAQASAFRRDFWPSRSAAEASFRKSPFYQSWDTRVLDRWCKYGIRDTPTVVFPDQKGATLTTTKHQECLTFLRPSWPAFSEDGKTLIKPDLVPDMDTTSPFYPLYRPEVPRTLGRLGELRPSVLYIFGEISPMSDDFSRGMKMEMTGTGLGGSGGVKAGRVKEIVLKGIGHLVAMEAAEACADSAAPWIGQEIKRFEKEKESYVEWTKKSLVEKQTLSDEWKQRIGGPLRLPKSKI